MEGRPCQLGQVLVSESGSSADMTANPPAKTQLHGASMLETSS